MSSHARLRLAPLALVAAYACGSDDPAPARGDADGGTGGTATAGGGSASGGSAGSAGGTASGGAADASGGTGGPNADLDPPASCGGVPSLKSTPVADALTRPLFVTVAPGDTSRLFIVQQDGKILVLKDGQKNAVPFLDVGAMVRSEGEQGLLGLAFHPGYAQNGRFFIRYSTRSGDANVLAEYARDPGDADIARPTATRILLSTGQPNANHNGGMLAFAPDGTLFLGTGDGGGANDPGNHAQNPSDPLGKLLRIDVDAADPVAQPPRGNMGGEAHPLVFAYGLRNPWRFSFDRKTQELFIGDVGQGAQEEIDVAPWNAAGINYGWRCREGSSANPNIPACTPQGDVREPAWSGPAGSITGGYVYRGRALPCLRGRYIFGDFNRSQFFHWQHDGRNGGVAPVDISSQLNPLGISLAVTSFGEDTAGEIYIAHYGTGDAGTGAVYRIDAQ